MAVALGPSAVGNYLQRLSTVGISAISPSGRRYFHCQDQAILAADVMGVPEHWLHEVAGPMVIIWDEAPIHRSPLVKEFLAYVAVQRLHVERLLAYAPELNAGEGLWAHLKGVELRNVCCLTLRNLRDELRKVVKRAQRKTRIIQGGFRCANL